MDRWLPRALITYLGPIRDIGHRIQPLQSPFIKNVGTRGQFLARIAAQSFGLQEAINHYFSTMGIEYSLEVQRHSLAAHYSEILLQTTTTPSVVVGLSDVGFGIQQVLPVLAEYASLNLSLRSGEAESATLLVEQPELHLHPRLQCELASVLSGATDDDPEDPDFMDRSKATQTILETHSEHMVLRLQRLVRRGELEPSDVSLLAIATNREDNSTVIQRIPLSPSGDFEGTWPEGFFDERATEILEG